MSMEIEGALSEAITLANLAEGKAEEEFQHALAQVGDIFDNAAQYERGKDDVIRATITVSIDLERRGDDRWVSADVRSAVRLPKRKRQGRTVVFRQGHFLVPEEMAVQRDLFGDGGGYPPSGPAAFPTTRKDTDA